MINIFYRKKREGVNSIESVFSAIDLYLYKHENVFLPHSNASLISLLKNILYVKKNLSNKNHITGDIHYAVIGSGKHSLLTIHDVRSALKGNFLKQLYIKLLWFWIPTFIAKKISVISQSTYDDVVKLCPWTKSKISIIPNPYNIAFEGKIKDKINEKPRILHIGTKPNKNLERVIDALSDINCELIIIGKLTNHQLSLLKDSGIHYKNKYDIPVENLIEEYRKCDIVSFPSTFEGFGMPVIEGQAAMRSVLAGNIPVLRDIAGEKGALFVDPFDVKDIRKGFKKLIEDSTFRCNLVKVGMENIKRFHPEKISDLYNKIYEEL